MEWLTDPQAWIALATLTAIEIVLGTAMPRGLVAKELRQKLEPVTVALLLPMFFTCSGLNTRLDLIADRELVLLTLAGLFASIAGKGVACWAAARLSGQDPRTSLAIGTLMNARGLMELILVDIGLRRGVILQPVFAMLVLMAIVTTLMATPLFELVYGRHHKRGSPSAAA